jgi:hypothetical protein
MHAAPTTEATLAARITRTFVFGLLALVAATALTILDTDPASAGSYRRWTGAGADANWTNPANWTGGAPVAGDVLVFGEGAARKTNVNNFPVDTSFDSIVFEDNFYNLTGNRVRLTDGVLTYHATPAYISATLTLAVRVPELLYFDATAANHSVLYKGGLVLDADATFQGLGGHVVTGPITGPGAIIGAGGVLTLAGTSASTGPIKVKGGQVNVNGTYPGRPVTVSAGTLAGSGTAGPVTAAGSSTPSTLLTGDYLKLKVTGDLTLTTVSQYKVWIDTPTEGRYGQVAVSGKVSLNGTPLAVVNPERTTSFLTVGQVLTIVKNNGPVAVAGTFRNAPEGATVKDAGDTRITYRISYKGGTSGRDITLTVLTMK